MIQYALRQPGQLAPILKALRRKSGMSQADLATRLGVTHQAISQLERNPERATLERLMRVFDALRLELLLRPRVGGSAAPGEW